MPDAPTLQLRTLLRAATGPAHARVDALMADGFDDARGYRAYLAGMLAFVDGLLPAVAPQARALGWALPGWDGLLRDDLARAGGAPLPGTAPLPACDRARALGALYVLEGSSLGARLLVRRARALGHDAATGAAFLHAHADSEGGRRWPRFLALLASADDPATVAPACAAAVQTFELAEHCLQRAKERMR